jgi:integrase
VHAAANDLKRHQYRPRALKKVRNTSMEIKPLADLDDSLSTVVKALNAARSDARKLVPGRDQWSTYRDVLLSQMMLSNPLRPAQFAAMTYRRDNTGNIYQTSRGVWRMRFNASDFKNERGAAHEDYDVAIARSLWPHIVQYLRAVRPHLLGAETDFVFLPTDLSQRSAMRELKSGMWTGEDLSLRVGVLGTQLFPQMRSFSAYTLRHLVATAFLQRHPQQFTQLAKLLNDKLATVLRVYARETHDDAFDIQNGDIDDAMDDGENKD